MSTVWSCGYFALKGVALEVLDRMLTVCQFLYGGFWRKAAVHGERRCAVMFV
jgi:hypothetical protein